MQFPVIFLIVWFLALIWLFYVFIIKGRAILKQFPNLPNSDFEFIENRASGYSTESFKTKLGGGKKVVKLRLTKDQFWVYTTGFGAYVAERFDMIHLIPIANIKSVELDRGYINIKFTSNNHNKELVLKSSQNDELLIILSKKMQDFAS